MGRRVRNFVRRVGRVGEDLVRGTVDTVTGIVGGAQPEVEETPEVVAPITQEPTVEEVVTPTGQLSQKENKDATDTGLGDVESIFNAVTTGDSADPFSRLMKKSQDEEKKRKGAVM